MAITVSGLSTSLPIDSWIEQLVAIKQEKIDSIQADQDTLSTSKSALSTVKSSYSSLLSSLQKITDSSFGSTSDLFAQKSVTSSDSAKVSATVTALATTQTLKVSVSQLATSTVAAAANTASAKMTESTKVSEIAGGSVKAGDFSIYVDNTKYSISVASTDTIGDIMSRIESATGLSASVTDGKLKIEDEDGSSTIVVGSNSDTSTFVNATGLTKSSNSVYESSNPVLLANTSKALTGTGAGFAGTITAGTFTIGNATFTVGSSTTLDSLISEINNNEDSGVNAYWDAGAGKLVLTSTTQGATNINVQAGTSNFTDIMGLTASGKVAANSQTLGTHAIFTVNGTTMTSQSNTVTSDVSGIQGLTINLNDKTTTNTTITVSSDNSSLKTAVNSFITSFNKVISDSDESTGTDGYLNGESVLTMIRNNLRGTVTASIESGDEGYKTLSSIGITTGAVGSGIDANTNQLVIDEKVFSEALASNPEAVKKLLLGDENSDGVMKKLSNIVNDALDPLDGYFVNKTVTYETQIKDLQESIDEKTLSLEEYRTELENKFSVMEQLIASLNSQLSAINAVISQTSSS